VVLRCWTGALESLKFSILDSAFVLRMQDGPIVERGGQQRGRFPANRELLPELTS